MYLDTIINKLTPSDTELILDYTMKIFFRKNTLLGLFFIIYEWLSTYIMFHFLIMSAPCKIRIKVSFVLVQNA